MLDREAYRIGWEESQKALLRARSALSVSIMVNCVLAVLVFCLFLGVK